MMDVPSIAQYFRIYRYLDALTLLIGGYTHPTNSYFLLENLIFEVKIDEYL